jgi:polyisoprenoid-binding protein YceI
MTIAIPPVGSYRLDPASSRIDFVATHGFNAPVPGTFDLTSGEVVVTDDPKDATITTTIDAASVSTGNRLRDAEVRSALFLRVRTFPTIEFTTAGRHRQDGSTWILDGFVRAHGTDVPTPLTLTSLELTADGFVAAGTARVDRFAHGVKGARGIIGKYLDLAVTVRAQR